ncbi:MAG TPA: type II toxin-antitoxin system VapC family toxin [Bacteroidota bacterium]|nr:type II toxin-antitoxin system VapC family toxin [Bacteroidota bacterium]
MKTIVLDSQPVVAYFEKGEGWESVGELLQSAAEEKIKLSMSVINWGEVYYIALREYGEEHAERVNHALKNMPIEILDVDIELTLQAARLKARGGIAYADCFAAALAVRKKAELVTGDREFKAVADVIDIRWIK